ncbi:MAG: hypothetical protein ACW972_11530 [Promethearchaeota archaeon]|jgi:hypothetical protein
MSGDKVKQLKLTKDEKERHEQQEKLIKEAKASPKTDILNYVRFKSKLDEEIFNLLPLSDAQKEELVLSVEFNKTVNEITDQNWNKRLSPKYSGIQEIKEEVGEELEQLESKE